MKKVLSLILALSMCMSMAACSQQAEETTATETTTEAVTEQVQESTEVKQAEETVPEKTGFELAYTESMAAQGYETLVLDEIPNRIVCATSSAVMTLYEMGAELVAIPGSAASTKYILEENPEMTTIDAIASDDYDLETIIALEPDLVIMSASYADSHGATLNDLGIAVYYLAAGHGVSYSTAKEEAICMINAFSVDEESTALGENLIQGFADVEEAAAAVSTEYEGKSVLILMAYGAMTPYVQGSTSTLGALFDMIGFENCGDLNGIMNFSQMDMETALVNQPDLIVVTGAGDEAAMEETFATLVASNSDYWNSISAVADNEVLYLGQEYVSVYGIGYIDTLNNLMAEVENFYAE